MYDIIQKSAELVTRLHIDESSSAREICLAAADLLCATGMNVYTPASNAVTIVSVGTCRATRHGPIRLFHGGHASGYQYGLGYALLEIVTYIHYMVTRQALAPLEDGSPTVRFGSEVGDDDDVTLIPRDTLIQQSTSLTIHREDVGVFLWDMEDTRISSLKTTVAATVVMSVPVRAVYSRPQLQLGERCTRCGEIWKERPSFVETFVGCLC